MAKGEGKTYTETNFPGSESRIPFLYNPCGENPWSLLEEPANLVTFYKRCATWELGRRYVPTSPETARSSFAHARSSRNILCKISPTITESYQSPLRQYLYEENALDNIVTNTPLPMFPPPLSLVVICLVSNLQTIQLHTRRLHLFALESPHNGVGLKIH